MIVQFFGKRGKLVVVCDYSETLCTVLADERFNDAECLSAARRADHPCAAERVGDVHPTLAELPLVVVTHGDVDGILVLLQLPALLETLVLVVEAVLQQTLLEELGDVVKGDVYQHHANYGGKHIEPDVQTQGIEPRFHLEAEQPDRKNDQPHTCHQRVENLFPCIELKMFLVPRAYAGNADEQERGELAVCEVAVVVDHPPLYASVYVTEDAAPVVKHRRVNGILEELQQNGYVDDRPEDLVKTL